MLFVDLAARATVIFLAAFVTTRALRRAAAATRHLTWTLAVVGVLALPALVLALPEWPILPGSGPAVAPAHAGAPGVAVLQSLDASASVGGPVRASTSASGLSVVDAALAIWGLVAGALVARIAAGVGAVHRLARYARPADARLRHLLDRVATAAGTTGPIRLLVSADVSTPMTWGGGRPLLLLPEEAHDWSDERVCVVLLHEIAHIRRADWLTHAISRLVVALHWFNPLAWIAMQAMTRERERACDDFVVARGAPAADYARHLFEIARHERPGPAWGVAPAMARCTELEGRLLSILTPHRREARRAAAPVVTLAAIAAAILVSTAAPAQEPQPHPIGRQPASTGSHPSPPPPSPPAVVEDAASARQEARRDRAVRKALAAALEDQSDDVREKAALGLALRSGADVVELLLQALNDPSPQVREKAALGLAFRRHAGIVEALIEAAQDEDAQVREKAVFALGVSGDPRAVPALAAAAQDPDAQVREKAVQGLALAR